MVLPILGANTESAAYEISNSARFVDDASGHLTREFDQDPTGNRKTFTLSFWVKRSGLDVNQAVVSASTTNNFNDKVVGFRSTDAIEVNNVASGSDAVQIVTNRLFRDVSAWYHIVVGIDTTQSSLADGVKFYVNGVRDTDYDGTPVYNQDATFEIARNGSTTSIGRMQVNNTQFLDGYLTEVNFIDGQQLDPTSFGRFNTNGVWVPKEYTGTYGNNGFFLQFKQTGTSQNSSGIGADTSGNDQHFAVNNMGATEITTDTCTNNFATKNILTAGADEPEMRHGGLQQYAHGTSNSAGIASTIMPDKGKWYVELFLESPSGGDYPFFGITDQRNLNQQNANGTKMAAGFEIDGATNNQSNTFLGSITNTNTGWPTFADNDIVMFALDLDNRKLWIGRNDNWINSGDPAAGSNEQLSWTLSTNVSVMMLGYDGGGGGGAQSKWNYGNPPYSTSSSQSDANGYGDFEYQPPSGYYALCTKNLAEYG